MFPWFVGGLAEKALLLASVSEWEQALDTAQRVLEMQPDNLDALKVMTQFDRKYTVVLAQVELCWWTVIHYLPRDRTSM